MVKEKLNKEEINRELEILMEEAREELKVYSPSYTRPLAYATCPCMMGRSK
jgi:hypothetical protein